jgi:hypothetical protein
MDLGRLPAPTTMRIVLGQQTRNPGFQTVAVMSVGGREPDGQRQPGLVGQNMQLGARFTPVHWTRTGEAAPLFART